MVAGGAIDLDEVAEAEILDPSLFAEKLWVADFCCTRFEVLGGLVKILRETADHAF